MTWRILLPGGASWVMLLGVLFCACSRGDGGGPAAADAVDVAASDVPVRADGTGRYQTPPGTVTYTEERPPCSEANPWRNLYFGDLHAHTLFSFDAQAYDVLVTPEEAYGFARGAPVELPPLDEAGAPTRQVRLERPLDFAALTDHGEYLGEIYHCTVPEAAGFNSPTCQAYRDPAGNGAFQFGTPLSSETPQRFEDICGPGGELCVEAAKERWHALVEAAAEASDMTSECRFTAFAAYEYTNTLNISNMHRNILFRTTSVPALPVTYFEAPTPESLWTQLDASCLSGVPGCDVMSLPHNSNLSNGNLFYLDPGLPQAKRKALASLRERMEPLVEIFQHKGDSECRNGFVGAGTEDPFCDFEKLRPPGAEVCDGEPGMGGMRLWGCSHPLDFVRNVLLEGLKAEADVGINPFRLGFIGGTDTHNGTPGLVNHLDFGGHIGSADDRPEERLGQGNVTHDGIINNPGGLTAIWAVENSRDALFEALRRREVYATSGPRIEVRFFGGWEYSAEGLCADPDSLPEAGYLGGVPMGGLLPPRVGNDSPVFAVFAHMDPGTEVAPGVPLQRIQVVKGWLDEAGDAHQAVYDVAGGSSAATVDVETCERSGDGHDALCAVWSDPEFDPGEAAFYYARILENPSCRWSARRCLEVPPASRPELCESGVVPKVVQHRAWASPIFYVP